MKIFPSSVPEEAAMKREHLTIMWTRGGRAILHAVLTATPDGKVTKAYRIFKEDIEAGDFKPTTETWYDDLAVALNEEDLR